MVATVRARKAVIPAAGLGTRFLPLTKASPKELLPMGEVPSLQLVIEEAVGAGIETVIVVNHPSKTAVERYFDPAPELLATLEQAGKHELAERLRHLDRARRAVRAPVGTPRARARGGHGEGARR